RRPRRSPVLALPTRGLLLAVVAAAPRLVLAQSPAAPPPVARPAQAPAATPEARAPDQKLRALMARPRGLTPAAVARPSRAGRGAPGGGPRARGRAKGGGPPARRAGRRGVVRFPPRPLRGAPLHALAAPASAVADVLGHPGAFPAAAAQQHDIPGQPLGAA